ncbi:MAG: AraC family transcriptional regulator [Sphingomonadaceae bacterium]|nr:AraC family transcriptional regulator [Sphingomonadaceae bacterium]
MAKQDDSPKELKRLAGGQLQVSLLEWDWPSIVDYTSSQENLAVERSLPPYSSSGTACFPELDPANFCLMGSVFIRYPGHLVRARGPGGKIRILRCELSKEASERLIAPQAAPDFDLLKALLNIQSPQLRAVLELIQHEMELDAPDSGAALGALGEMLEVAVARELRAEAGQQSGCGLLPDWQFRRIKDMLADRGGRMAVKEIASACGISTRHLQRQFHRLTGRTVSEFVQSFWIEQAKELLARGDLPIAQISEQLNFSCTSAFSRAFHKQVGLTASNYRRMVLVRPAQPRSNDRRASRFVNVSQRAAGPAQLHQG